MPDTTPFDLGVPATISAPTVIAAATSVRPPFPSAVDSTMLKTFRECPRKFELEYLHHWKSKAPSVHLHAGQAFAKALEVTRTAFYSEGKTSEESLQAGAEALIEAYGHFDEPHDTAKTLPRMLGALDYYFEAWPLDSDPLKPHEWAPGKFGIEFSFASPLPFDHPVTGDPLLYTGRADMLAEMGGALYIEDDKTASQLGSQWLHQWDLRSQFTGYCWSAKRVAGLPVQGAIVRGVSILKTKYDHAQLITYRQDWMIDRWINQVLHDLARMREAWESGYFDYNLDEACNSYGGCLFRRICLTEHPGPWLQMDYEQRVWDPLAREERKVVV
jgi:hypothetical protein